MKVAASPTLLITTILRASKAIYWIYLLASLQTLMSGTYHVNACPIVTVTKPNLEAHDVENPKWKSLSLFIMSF